MLVNLHDADLPFPRDMIIEAASRCNFLCPLCLWTHNKDHGYLRIDTFRRFIDEARAFLDRVCFAGRGEPTLNPELYALLRASAEAGVTTDLATNGSSLGHDVDALLDSGIDAVNVSIEADTAEEYVRYRRNGSFEEVTAGMAALAREKSRRRLTRPILRTCSVIFNYNEARLPEIERFFGGLGFEEFIFKSAHLGHGQLAEREEILSARWLPRDPSKRRRQYTDTHSPTTGVCSFLVKAHLLWNGDVCRCAIDQQQMVAGNINRQSFEDLWRGEASRAIVRRITAGQFPPCRNCAFSERRTVETGRERYVI